MISGRGTDDPRKLNINSFRGVGRAKNHEGQALFNSVRINVDIRSKKLSPDDSKLTLGV